METKNVNETKTPEDLDASLLRSSSQKQNQESKKTSFLVPNQHNRFKTELVRNNWKTILDVAMKKKKFDNFDNERIELLSPADDTTDDADQFEYDQILKDVQARKKCGKALVYDMHSSFNNFNKIKEAVGNGKIMGNSMVFKKQADNKYRYYCRYMKNGCKAALYLQLDEGTKGLCFVSDVDHTDHPENLELKEKIKSDRKTKNC
ncbi:unnamed protein product [Brachionus calyciflorus]|uniref:Uncharacterized protein n=1 Tax=Brachionus calyciflorus TaxID=104777 RepID=A0A814HZK3_9BILA|nr:unnamed protein product [Brachionus calyciflorus]